MANGKRWRRRAWGAGGLLAGVGIAGIAFAQIQVSGNIHPNSIEIDTPSANLFDSVAGGPVVDWVASNDGFTDRCLVLGVSGIGNSAICYQDNVSRAPGQDGTWNGFRVVDGLEGGDLDIFLTGGKENDTDTWNPGPGTVGSSKFDATQMYIANNETDLFFGMERRGNNGTTAFDFEFNANGPNPADPRNDPTAYIPTRTVGDVLFSFEMTGSGNTGSASAHVFLWDGDSYEEDTTPPAGIVVSINQGAVAGAPWGRVSSQGAWVTGNLDRFTFAEAKVPIGPGGITLPIGADCTRSAFVQIRTRSSVSDTSDLKDTTPIFEYVFSGPTLAISKTGQSALDETVTTTGVLTGGGAPTTFQWQIFNRATSTWVNLTGATSAVLTFPGPTAGTFNFDSATFASTDLNAGNPFQVDVDGTTFFSKIRSVRLRLHVDTTVGGQNCPLDSNEVTVRKLVGVDP